MLIPWSGDFKGSRIVLIRLMKIVLSGRVLSGSFNPGVSISVMLPLVAILVRDVTDVKDFAASKTNGSPCL